MQTAREAYLAAPLSSTVRVCSFGSKGEILAKNRCLPLCPRKRTFGVRAVIPACAKADMKLPGRNQPSSPPPGLCEGQSVARCGAASKPGQRRQQAQRIARQVEVVMPIVAVAPRATRSRIYLRSRRHAPSQSAGGGSSCRLSMRFAKVIEGPSSGTASSAALKALRASSQRRARYAASPSEY